MKALPRMEAHILDGPHFLLETQPAECAALMSAFVRRVEGLHAPAELHGGGPPDNRLQRTVRCPARR